MTPNSFYLVNCPGVHNHMWNAVSYLIDGAIKTSLQLLPVFLVIRLSTDEFMNRYNGVVDLKKHVKTIFETVVIVCFLYKYKWSLEIFDKFISLIAIAKIEVIEEALANVDSGSQWKNIIGQVMKGISNFLTKYVFACTQQGAIMLMHYFKTILLMIASTLGPFAVTLSLLPGPFRKGFSNWSKHYINISCWTITLNILTVLTEAHRKAYAKSQGIGETSANVLMSIVLFFIIFLTPTITSYFVGGTIIPNISIITKAATEAGKKLFSGVKAGANLLGSATSGIAKGIKSIGKALKR